MTLEKEAANLRDIHWQIIIKIKRFSLSYSNLLCRNDLSQFIATNKETPFDEMTDDQNIEFRL